MNAAALGIWTAQFDFYPAAEVREAVQELEELGFGSIWVGENVGREPISQSGLLLAATNRITIATGIASIWARDPMATLSAQQTLSEAYPNRFILGLGVSHSKLVQGIRGVHYDRPVRAMRDYLTTMDRLAQRYRAVRLAETTRVLAALGPRMLGVAAAYADGAQSYLVPPEHTATAREFLGEGKLLVVEQAVVLEEDAVRGREIARRHVQRYLPLANYTNNLLRLGFSQEDLEHGGSDRLVDALVVWGDESAVAQRIADHREAGATHVCLQVLDADFRALPMPQWRRLAHLNKRPDS